MLVSITRLRLRKRRFTLPFLAGVLRSLRQARSSPGFAGLRLFLDTEAYWTMSFWHDEATMRAYVVGEPHRSIMPLLHGWCDEAATAHWTVPAAEADWAEAHRRLAAEGRAVRVAAPSPRHAARDYRTPRPVTRLNEVRFSARRGG